VTPAEALVDSLPRVTLVVGKGGVGKTTCASALALASSRSQRTLVLTTDPARALPAILQSDVAATAAPIPGTKLFAQYIDAAVQRERFMARYRAPIRAILDRGTYLDDEDITPMIDSALPGGDEIFAAIELAKLLASAEFERIVVDTAPTGHTLRLLDLPATFRALVQLLESMQAKHRFMVRALARAYRADDADRFLQEMERLVSSLERTLTDDATCRAVIVTNDEPVVMAESTRLASALHARRVAVGAVVWNGAAAAEPLTNAPQYTVARLDAWPIGPKGLARWLAAMRPAKKAPSVRSREPEDASVAHASLGGLIDSVKPLTIVAGKGGVGKTSVAATLALAASDSHRTLVVSTDPAPSLGDALGQEIPDADTPVAGAPRLTARQLDATAAFARMRDDYQQRIDAVFEGLMGKGMDLAHDRAIARDLLALAPPGVDEVYGLSLIADTLAGNQYERIVVDPAPTGHLLRLLEMPKMALDWTHQLMRLMLKYKDVVGLGDTARDLLAFSQSLRAIDAQLRDPARAAVVLVALDEPVVRDETERLARAIGDRGVAVGAVVLNRAERSAALPVASAPMHLVAPTAATGPIGIGALRRWGASWTAQ
jgi:arsenite/tail-anchored protein-transporting ATPase